MTKKTITFFALVASLTFTGVMSGFMVALLHGLQGDWWYMAIQVTICTFGFFVLKPFVKQAYEMAKTEGVNL